MQQWLREAVGIGVINSFELLVLQGTVENLDALKTVERDIVNQVCESKHPPTQGNLNILLGA